jgi:hypothetical protein
MEAAQAGMVGRGRRTASARHAACGVRPPASCTQHHRLSAPQPAQPLRTWQVARGVQPVVAHCRLGVGQGDGSHRRVLKGLRQEAKHQGEG